MESVDKKRILVVEDEPDHLLACEMIFRHETDLLIYKACDTATAESVLEKEHIDLVLLDLALPGEDGISFCERMKKDQRYTDLPFVAFSAYPHQIYRDKALKAGCVDFLDKPFSPKELISEVRKHISET